MAIKTFTTGEVLTAADTNTYLANSGLVYITTASATSGSSLSVNNCFSSTYRNYQVVISNLTTAGVGATSFRLRASGTDVATSYYYNGIYMDYATTAITGLNGSNVSTWEPNIVTDTTMSAGVINFFNPFVAFRSSYNANGIDARTGGGGARTASGFHNANTSYDGFTFFTNSPITNILITVYGYRLGS